MCDFLKLGKVIAEMLLLYAGSVTVVLIIAAGVYMIVSGSAASQKGVETAKKMLTGAVIGLVIMISAWLIVGTIVAALGFGSLFGDIQCSDDSGFDTSASSGDDTGDDTGDDLGQGSGEGCEGYRFDSEIREQCGYASDQLNDLLTCMRAEMSASVGRISSIVESDNPECCLENKGDDSKCSGGCVHTRYSCHYGGRTCGPESYAVDFGDEENAPVIMAAANKCGGRSLFNRPGHYDHVHVSVGSCGCDESLTMACK